MSLVFATQLTAVATLALAVLALATAVLAGLAYLKQSREVSLLLEQAKRDTNERRRAQARSVFLAARDDEQFVRVQVHNASDLPIYYAQIEYSSKPESEEYLGMVMPGKNVSNTHRLPAEDALDSVTLTFRDAAGVYWSRMPNGSLWEVPSQSRPMTPAEKSLARAFRERMGLPPRPEKS